MEVIITSKSIGESTGNVSGDGEVQVSYVSIGGGNGMNIMCKCSYNLKLIKCEKLFTIYQQLMCITSLLHHFTALKRIIHISILGIKT